MIRFQPGTKVVMLSLKTFGTFVVLGTVRRLNGDLMYIIEHATGTMWFAAKENDLRPLNDYMVSIINTKSIPPNRLKGSSVFSKTAR